MGLSFFPYELKSRKLIGKSSGPIRSGALLRIRFPDLSSPGYADCHPWPELGDAPLDEQLRLLSQGAPAALGKRSLTLARRDAEARTQGKSLFSGRNPPPSHVLAGDALNVSEADLDHWRNEGFWRVKLKAGKNPVSEAAHLRMLSSAASKREMKIRIDFNESLSLNEAMSVFDGICANSGESGVDFIEDPVPFSSDDWSALKERFPLRLALDRGATRSQDGPRAFDVVVLKPAIQDPSPWIERARSQGFGLVITSYLDHALGVTAAMWEGIHAQSALGDLLLDCGWMTPLNYEEDSFSRQFRRQGNLLLPPNGTGFGFDEDLKRLAWKELS
jgi:O-succinylbenzoate synthase